MCKCRLYSIIGCHSLLLNDMISLMGSLIRFLSMAMLYNLILNYKIMPPFCIKLLLKSVQMRVGWRHHL